MQRYQSVAITIQMSVIIIFNGIETQIYKGQLVV